MGYLYWCGVLDVLVIVEKVGWITAENTIFELTAKSETAILFYSVTRLFFIQNQKSGEIN